MAAIWTLPDYDDHEAVHFFRDSASSLTAIVAVHSSHLGPAGGGTRYWHYADSDAAVTDALRLSRGMSYKNAMAGLAMGGGKAVILANPDRTKTPEMIAAFARSINSLSGQYVTAQDVGMSAQDMIMISKETRHVCGLPAAEGMAGGDPGPSTAYGVYLGIKAAVKRALGRDTMAGVHVAIQGLGSVGGGVARRLAADGARLTLADIDPTKAEELAHELGATAVSSDDILGVEADVLSPCALGAILTEHTVAGLRAPIIAGGANNQLATPGDGDRVQARGILYAPDYVINAGGIINVAIEYLEQGDRAAVMRRIDGISHRLNQVWDESHASGDNAAKVADRIAQGLIGRG